VLIATSEPVAIVASTVTNLAGGDLIESPYWVQGQVTLDRVTAYGGNGRFLEAENFRSVTIRNCTVIRTGGIKLITPVEDSFVLITQTRQRNVQRGNENFGQFVQLAEVQNATVEVSWNEVISEFGRSEVEDVISVYKSSHARIHDNYLEGGYPLRNVASSSANGITIEAEGATVPTSFDNEIWNNTVVDNVGGIGLVGGYDNYAHHNRVVQDGKLPGGAILRAANLGMAVWNSSGDPRWANNRARYNVIGFVHARGYRNDMWFPDAPGEYALNRSMRGKVRRATERAEWAAWVAKLAANKIRVGA
jgi:hypothetical protein